MGWYHKTNVGIKLLIGFIVNGLIACAAGFFISYISMTNKTGFPYFIILVLGCGLVGCMLLGLYISRSISRPIREVTRLGKALAAGNLDETIKIKSKDEIGELSEVFNKDVRTAFKQVEEDNAMSGKMEEYRSRQLKKVLTNIDKLAVGDLNYDIALDKPDEDTKSIYEMYCTISGKLENSFKAIKGYIDEISYITGEMAKGDLNVEITSEYMGDFIGLKKSINQIINWLNGMFHEIRTAAEQVSAGSHQVSDGNQAISQGATEQASSIEELSASVESIAAQVKQNAEDAAKSAKIAAESKDNAVDGDGKMKKMLQSMDEINESSVNISKIIKVIDDIAFQTNILALNAAVEAARAGVHGKGFAVVAEEVRNLAARSANAAKETTVLIEGSVKKAETGMAIAGETAKALAGIVSGSEESVQLLSGIAQASNEQATGIAQINKGIEQMSQVVQTNSATAEESAAASEELSSQAEFLKDMINKTRLREDSKTEDVHKSVKRSAIADDGNGRPRIVLNDGDFGKY